MEHKYIEDLTAGELYVRKGKLEEVLRWVTGIGREEVMKDLAKVKERIASGKGASYDPDYDGVI